MFKRSQRFLGILTALGLVLSGSFVSVGTSSPHPVHAATSWSGGGAAGSGKAAWETFAGPVNVVNGNLMISTPGLSLAGVNGMSEVIAPIYNSLSAGSSTDMGRGWTMGLGRDVGLDLRIAGSATFYDSSGRAYAFSVPSTCTFVPPPGIDAQLACAGSNYTLTSNASGTQYQFDGGGNLTAVQNRQGNAIGFAYNGAGQLTQITGSTGQVTTISYNAQNFVSQVTSPGSPIRNWTYGYDVAGNADNRSRQSNGDARVRRILTLDQNYRTTRKRHHVRL